MNRAFKRAVETGGRCMYCGDVAGARDHYLGWESSRDSRYVPCCGSCNSILGASLHRLLGERALAIKQSLERRHRKALAVGSIGKAWGVQGNLKALVLAKAAELAGVKSRLSTLAQLAERFGAVELAWLEWHAAAIREWMLSRPA